MLYELTYVLIRPVNSSKLSFFFIGPKITCLTHSQNFAGAKNRFTCPKITYGLIGLRNELGLFGLRNELDLV